MGFLFFFALMLITANADPHASFGFMVRLDIFKEGQCLVCSGSLVTRNWILTAAHCIHDADYVYAVVGASQNKGYRISKNYFSIHPSFAALKNGFDGIYKLENDIALIEFFYETTRENISFVHLPDKNILWELKESQLVHVSQFDTACMEWLSNPSIYSVITGQNSYCEPEDRHILPGSSEDADQLCIYTPHAVCSGDTSGHLIIPSTRELIGIMSHPPIRYCGNSYPIIFTRVKSYVSWIEEVLKRAESD